MPKGRFAMSRKFFAPPSTKKNATATAVEMGMIDSAKSFAVQRRFALRTNYLCRVVIALANVRGLWIFLTFSMKDL